MLKLFFALMISALLAGCAALQEKIPIFGKQETKIGGVYRENLDADRLVDLVIVKKLTGEKSLGLFTKYTLYLEGYIRGVVVDYEDNPIEGSVVRVTDKGKDSPGFDPGISDANGVYRIRFSLPIKKKKVDQRGAIAYNPPWQQQLDMLGAALEPQTKETKFRLYFDQEAGIIGIGEDIPKTITRKVTASTAKEAKGEEKDKKAKLPEKKGSPNAQTPTAAPKKKEDFFGGFGDFGK